MTVERESPAKVNLLLNVLGKRGDGFHELETILQPCGVCDHLSFEPRSKQRIDLSCSNPALPTGPENLVFKAATKFFEVSRIQGGVRIRLEKHIPLAAGLGGGSSNAAHTLLGLNELFDHPLTQVQLQEIAAALGSDVPFFLQPFPALATGRGERVETLTPFPALRDTALVLAYPGFGVATAWTYQRLASFPEVLQGSAGRAQRLLELLRTSDLAAVGSALFNSLEAPVLEKYPLLALYQEFLRENGAPAVLMSGSGSTTFAIVENDSTARKLVQKFIGHFGKTCWTKVVAL